MNTRSWRGLSGLLLAVAAAMGLGAQAVAQAAPEKAVTPVTVGVLNVSDSAPLYLAIQRGIFKQHGLEVSTTPAPSGAQAVSGLVSGGMQFAFGSYVPFIIAAERGIGLKIAVSADNVNDSFSRVVVLKSSDIHSVADLKGKKVAVSALVNFGTLAVQVALKSAGLSADDVKLVTVPFPNMAVALTTGQVDAAWLVEPFLTDLNDTGKIRDLFNPFSGDMANIPAAGYLMTDRYAEAHPEIVKAFRAAMTEATEMAVKDPSLIRKVIPTYTKIPAAVAERIALPAYASTVNPAQLQHLADVMRSYGLLKQKVDTSKLLYP
ncbi:MAG TPA: ABC transporter substrate-binding protein [Nevskiaceae bacterium]